MASTFGLSEFLLIMLIYCLDEDPGLRSLQLSDG